MAKVKSAKPRYGLDIDGVYADFVHGFSHLACSMGVFPRAYASDEQAQWDFAGQINEGRSLNEVWRQIEQSMNWWMGLEPLARGVDITATNHLIEDATVFFITSRGDTRGLSVEAQTAGWLRGIGINVDKATVIAAEGAAMKGGLAQALRLDAFLDDNVGNLEAIAQVGTTAVARTWLYNKGWAGPRTDSIFEFIANEVGRAALSS